MKVIYLIIVLFSFLNSYGQQTPNRFVITKKIDNLLSKRAECFRHTKTSLKYYHVQIYNGQSINTARAKKTKFLEQYPDTHVTVEWESPEFKVWVGEYETKLAADQALLKYRKNFPNAFIVNPKK